MFAIMLSFITNDYKSEKYIFSGADSVMFAFTLLAEKFHKNV